MTRDVVGSGKLTLQLANSLSAIEEGRLALLAYLDPLGIDPRILNRLEVVFEELVSNIVRHGDASRLIRIEAARGDGEILLSVEDNGPCFNPLELPEPAPFTTLESATLGGLGIPLVRRLTSRAEYARIGEGDDAHNLISVAIPLA